MTDQGNTRRFVTLALLGAALPAVWLILDVLLRLGHWEYALDDAYIHLAMSDQLARGGYGVNAGEAASASSSILYSYLLAPFAGFGWHWLVPLAIGQVTLWAAAAVFGMILAQSAPKGGAPWHWPLIALAMCGPWLMHWPGMSVLGMEHMLHILIVLCVLLGLLRLFRDGGLSVWLILGIILGPLVRFEGAGLSILALGVMALRGQGRAAVFTGIATMIPLIAHFWHMSQLGLDFLPNSVTAKSAAAGGGMSTDAPEGSRLQAIAASARDNLGLRGGRTMAGMIVVWLAFVLFARSGVTHTIRLLGWLAVGVLAGHLALGSTVFLERYEIYAISFAVVAGIVALTRWKPASAVLARGMPVLFVMALVYGLFHYPLRSIIAFGPGSQAIHAQQAQMGRFLDDYWQGPVAVNDLGHVAYRNPHYVLDLWGLANARALRARQGGEDPTWVDQLTREYDVELAMIYDHWLGHHMPTHWIKLGELWLTVPRATVGVNHVDIYAAPGAAVRARAALLDFEPSLPASAELRLLPESET